VQFHVFMVLPRHLRLFCGVEYWRQVPRVTLVRFHWFHLYSGSIIFVGSAPTTWSPRAFAGSVVWVPISSTFRGACLFSHAPLMCVSIEQVCIKPTGRHWWGLFLLKSRQPSWCCDPKKRKVCCKIAKGDNELFMTKG
jgi:hypothetical protein